MSGVSPDAILGAATTATVVLGGALWKFATMLAEVRSQVRHNGGASLKDYAQKAAGAADKAAEVAARVDERAERVEVQLAASSARSDAFRSRLISEGAANTALLGRLQHDTTAVRIALALHVYEAQAALAAVRAATGTDVAAFTTPEGSPLPNGDPEVAAASEKAEATAFLSNLDHLKGTE